MAYLPGQQYVQNAAGVWTPVGYAAGALPAPQVLRDPVTARSSRISSFGTLHASPLIGLINSTFYSSAALTGSYTIANTGTGATTANSTDGFFTMTTGATAGSTSRIDSIDNAVYNGLSPLLFLDGLRLGQAGVAGVVRRWGMFDTTGANGYFFEDRDGVLGVVSRKNGVDTRVASSAFNGTLTASDINSHIWEIEVTGGRAVFSQDGVLLHTITPAAGSTTTSATLNFIIRVDIANGVSAVAYTIEGRGQNIGRIGTVDTKRLNEPLQDASDASLVRAVMNGTTGPNAYQALLIKPDGVLPVRPDPVTLIFDTFEIYDTVNSWTATGTVPPTLAVAGNVSASAGTAANATSISRTQPVFTPGSNAFLQLAQLVQIEAAVLTGSTRWWGLGVPSVAPTTTTPITNGAIFEIGASDGLLYGRVYSGGVKTQEIALTRPADGAVHRYQLLYKGSKVYFNIDNTEVGSIPFPNPTVGALPVSFGSINGAVAVASSPVLTTSHVGVADSAANEIALKDGIFQWRKTRVTAAGELYVTDSNRIKQSVGIAHSGRFTVGAAADATAIAGRFWLINPVGSTILIELRRVEFSSAPTAATAFPSAPRVTVERVTFTGVATGAIIAPAVRDTNEPALIGSVRAASTGLTLTAGNTAYAFTVAPVLTAAGAAVPVLMEWEPLENGRIVLRAGQGIVIRQADAGTTADTRSFAVNFAWAEYTVTT